MCLIFGPFLILFCIFTFPFPMIFNFYIIKKITFQKLFATHQFGKRWCRVFEYGEDRKGLAIEIKYGL
jgi:hypothetical protein